MDPITPRVPNAREHYGRLLGSLLIIALILLLAGAVIVGFEIFLLVFAGILFGVFLRSIAVWLVDKTAMGDRWAVGLTIL